MFSDLNLEISDLSWNIQDATKLGEFQRCPRKYFFKYVLGWKSDTPSIHLVFGSAHHKAMEIFMRKGTKKENLVEAYDAFLTEYRKHFDEAYDELIDTRTQPKTPMRELAALSIYINRYQDEPFKPLEIDGTQMIEIGGRCMLNEEFTIAYRMDGLMRRNDGTIFAFEHKSGSPWHRWEDEWTRSIQIDVYSCVCRCLIENDEKFGGVLINGVLFKKTKTNPKLDAEMPERNFELKRTVIKHPMDQLGIKHWTIIDLCERVKYEFERLSKSFDSPILQCFPMNQISCYDFGRECSYIHFCKYIQNPLTQYDSPPLGFHKEFWNPLDEDFVEINVT